MYNSFQDTFLGQVKVTPDVFQDRSRVEGWFRLEARDPEAEQITGEIFLRFSFQKTEKKHYGPEDFPVLRLIGKGMLCAALLVFLHTNITKVLLVKSIRFTKKTHDRCTP